MTLERTIEKLQELQAITKPTIQNKRYIQRLKRRKRKFEAELNKSVVSNNQTK